ncbi:hypothetical protein PIB30_010488 [Stylosanthes scabra]|uniref:Uncharacterized protein n=1 Tax=Stylosanthes scabra TaxID=79078 RepID=A0ABU6Q5D2_9FABA|nr:hypothetical protein [Stylosanthes scabra]
MVVWSAPVVSSSNVSNERRSGSHNDNGSSNVSPGELQLQQRWGNSPTAMTAYSGEQIASSSPSLSLSLLCFLSRFSCPVGTSNDGAGDSLLCWRHLLFHPLPSHWLILIYNVLDLAQRPRDVEAHKYRMDLTKSLARTLKAGPLPGPTLSLGQPPKNLIRRNLIPQTQDRRSAKRLTGSRGSCLSGSEIQGNKLHEVTTNLTDHSWKRIPGIIN